jgi:hypothetical protein
MMIPTREGISQDKLKTLLLSPRLEIHLRDESGPNSSPSNSDPNASALLNEMKRKKKIRSNADRNQFLRLF